jgi:Amt family ammonium transporter
MHPLLKSKKYLWQIDFFFQVVFVATAMSIVSGAVAERMKLFSFFAFALVFTAIIYPLEGQINRYSWLRFQ